MRSFKVKMSNIYDGMNAQKSTKSSNIEHSTLNWILWWSKLTWKIDSDSYVWYASITNVNNAK